MLRRSNSSSHIPVPRSNLFGYRETGITSGLRRTKSSIRLSQNNEQSNAAKKPKRTTSLERVSTTSRLSKLTPLNLNKPGRGHSLLKSTPGSSSMSQRTCGSRVTQSDSALKERKTIQKLSTDKIWVVEQFLKVQHFIDSSQLFDPSIVTPNNIKPPSIKAFIYITSVLFREMFPNVQLTSQNYKEIVPQKLKVLHYPGTIALSVLKTVNTMHAWPQVVGMFGWLIDKINIAKNSDHISLDTLEPEERQKYLMAKNAENLLVNRYLIFNDRDDPDEIAAANAEYLKNMANILEFDQDEHARLKKDMLHKQEYKKNIEAEVEKLESENQKLASQVQEIKAELHQNSESDAQEEAELQAELQRLEKGIKKTKEKKTNVKENIAQLTEAIKTQPCSFREKVDLLKRIDALKDKRDIVVGKIEHAQKIKRDFDAKLNAEQSALQNQVIDWNRSLMEVSIKKPHLRKLMLKETGFHNPCYLDEIKEVSRLKIEIESEMAEKMVNMEIDLREKTVRKRAVEIEIESLEKTVMEFDEQIRRCREKQLEIEKDILKKKDQWDREREELMKELNNPLKIGKLELLSEKESRLRNEMESLDETVKNLCKKIVCFFVDLHKQVKHNITEMTNIMKNVEKDFEQRALQALTNQYRIMDALAELEGLEETSD